MYPEVVFQSSWVIYYDWLLLCTSVVSVILITASAMYPETEKNILLIQEGEDCWSHRMYVFLIRICQKMTHITRPIKCHQGSLYLFRSTNILLTVLSICSLVPFHYQQYVWKMFGCPLQQSLNQNFRKLCFYPP